MTGMEDRGEALENKFFHDQDFRFKAMARRNRLMGLWVADKLGMTGDDAEAYAKEVIITALEQSGDDGIVNKISADVKKSNIAHTEADIREKMAFFLQEAIAQLQSA